MPDRYRSRFGARSPFRERLGRHPLDMRDRMESTRDQGLLTFVVGALIAGGMLALIGFVITR